IAALSKRSPSFLETISRETGMDLPIGTGQAELMSVSMAIQNLQLAAHALGLGSCCMTGPLLASDAIRTILDVRVPFELSAIIPVGRRLASPLAPPRKDVAVISEIIE
ncbi:MAG TPA: nitroreductase family protein, partial [Bacteroidota bacterium]|nr:nitroreductase family protein [Bacteroidota bacterium]